MIASAQTLRRLKPISPFHERTVAHGMSFGLSSAGYDIRVQKPVRVLPWDFVLACSTEHFHMPDNLLGIVHDKSTWARLGIALQNTVIEPGWCGYLTLELSNHSAQEIFIEAGSPIAQVVFHMLDEPTDTPYQGKYQNQGPAPQPAVLDSEPERRMPIYPAEWVL